MSDDNYVMVRLSDGNTGQHPIIGGVTKNKYGYRSHGDQFLIAREDLAAHPGKFKEVLKAAPIPTGVSEAKEETPAPQPVESAKVKVAYAEEQSIKTALNDIVSIERSFDLQTIPGVTSTIAKRMEEAGIDSLEDLADLSFDELMDIKGIAEARAEQIQAYVQEQLN